MRSLKIIYSFNKKGFEADYWTREIAAASNEEVTFIPFNHDPYVDTSLYLRAQALDNLYFAEDGGLMKMYADMEQLIRETAADALVVDNYFPYHPEFLRTLPVYKVIRTSDGPLTSYDREFAYLHAYDHALYHSPAYSRDMGMAEKMAYCGAKKTDFWPLASFDALCDPGKTRENILSGERDIDVVFIGALHLNKMPMIAKVKKAFGSKMRLHGLTSLKKNVYMNLKYGFPGWISPVSFDQYVPLYQRAKIGINIHNRGNYTVGSYRLFDLPANGVMQISDGGEYLQEFYELDREVVLYNNADDLIDKIKYYLNNDEERNRIALNGFDRVQREYKIGTQMRKMAGMVKKGIETKADQ